MFSTVSNAICRTARHLGLPRKKQSLWRLLWAVVLLLHAPITVSVFSTWWRGESAVRWSSLVLLAISNAFFIFEITHGYSLRLLADRRKLTAFLMVVALMHVGFIQHSVPELLGIADLRFGLLIATVSAITIRMLLDLIELGHLHGSGLAGLLFLHIRRQWYSLRIAEFLIRFSPVFVPLHVPPRAPPRH